MKTKIFIPVIFSSFCILHSAIGQGSLTPPGAPGPTMMTLSQIEPRTPIPSAPYTISQPGSYYLTTNLTVGSGQSGIAVEANNVSIDLNGFTISGAANGDGINGFSPYQQLVVRNGIIQNFFNGVDASVINGGVFENVTFFNNKYGGLAVASRFLIKDCQCFSNSIGLATFGSSDVLMNNNCSFNTNGFEINSGNRVEGNTAIGNGTGFYITGSSNLVIRNFAQGNNNNFNIGGNNNPGPIITGSMMATNNNPNANFSF